MAMTVQESFQKLGANFRGQGKKLFVIGMAVLLVIRLLIYGMEAGWSGPEASQPQIIKLESKLTSNSTTVVLVNIVTKPLSPFDESPYRAFAANNMFDPKRVLDAAEYEKRANEIYSDALVLYQQGSLEEARRRVDDALSLQANHLKAKDLKKTINDRLGIQEQPSLKDIKGVAATTATTQVAPTGTAPAQPGASPAAAAPPGAAPPGGAPPAAAPPGAPAPAAQPAAAPQPPGVPPPGAPVAPPAAGQ